jgi:hypothetical protein
MSTPSTPRPETPTDVITPIPRRRSLIQPQSNHNVVSVLLIQPNCSETNWYTKHSAPQIIRHTVIHSRGRVDYTQAFTTPTKNELHPNTFLYFIRKRNKMLGH